MVEQTPNEEQPEAAAAVHRGPPIEIAEEVLNGRGVATMELLKRTLGKFVVESGGRDDIPWVRVQRENLVEAAQRCQRDRDLAVDMLHCLLAVDYEEHIEIDYVLFSIANDRKLTLKVELPPDDARVDTVTGLWLAAGWYERETHDLFGVAFEGNADLSPLLLYEGFEGHPGLKSFPLHDYEEW
jgi:NADH-quinone oxidoreductase subunit C